LHAKIPPSSIFSTFDLESLFSLKYSFTEPEAGANFNPWMQPAIAAIGLQTFLAKIGFNGITLLMSLLVLEERYVFLTGTRRDSSAGGQGVLECYYHCGYDAPLLLPPNRYNIVDLSDSLEQQGKDAGLAIGLNALVLSIASIPAMLFLFRFFSERIGLLLTGLIGCLIFGSGLFILPFTLSQATLLATMALVGIGQGQLDFIHFNAFPPIMLNPKPDLNATTVSSSSSPLSLLPTAVASLTCFLLSCDHCYHYCLPPLPPTIWPQACNQTCPCPSSLSAPPQTMSHALWQLDLCAMQVIRHSAWPTLNTNPCMIDQAMRKAGKGE
jgi:hypothetical protein